MSEPVLEEKRESLLDMITDNQSLGEVVKSEQNITIPEKKFKPTPHMFLWLEKSMELGFGASVFDISKQAKVARTNWYMWIRNPDFVQWWDDQWQQYIKSARHKLTLIGLKKAETDYTYWSDMMKATGNVPTEVQPTPNATQVNVNLGKYIK